MPGRPPEHGHYEFREALLSDVAERALAQTVDAIDAADPRRGRRIEALDRLVAAGRLDEAQAGRALRRTIPQAFERVSLTGPPRASVIMCTWV